MSHLASIFRRGLFSSLLIGGFAQCQTSPPATPVAPVPDPSWAVRSEVYLRRLVSTQALVATFPGAGFDQLQNFPREWERTGTGFGRRVASQYGRFAVGETIEFGVSAFHSEDPRYYRMPDASVGRRIRHALISGVWVRTADGTHNTVAIARIANAYGSRAIQMSWLPPPYRTFSRVITRGSASLGLKASTNLFREFWPDIKKRVFHR